MDNFGLDILAEGRTSFDKALQLAFEHNAPGGKVTQFIPRALSFCTVFQCVEATAAHTP